ncbi:MAG: B12-binding domain-containing radical SAM protein [Desulfobacterales bacterium]|nr:B12-binding domain-containing radical SAM protein [Desulfobacterales bacterium]
MKIILINSPIRLKANPSCIPYGLATIASTLREYGFDVEIYDINALRPSKNEIITTLSKKKWDIIGISGLITTYQFQKWLITEIKNIKPDGIIISGGGLATSNSTFLFNKTDVDITVHGEGEDTMLNLCQTLQSGKNLNEIDGISFRQNANVIVNPKRKNIKNLDSIPFPAWDLLPMEIYLKNPIWGTNAVNSSSFKEGIKVTRSMNIISSRGCPFACNFCYHLFGNSDYRFRSAKNVIEEIEVLVDQYRVDFIGFVDDNMMASEKRLLEFCDLMEKKKFPITWGCHGRVTSAKQEILNRMAEVGCVWIGYGIESGSQKILDAMNKRVTVSQAKEAIINTRKASIYANTTFIFGYPSESLETIQETINFKREMNINCPSFFATPYPCTPLYEQMKHIIGNEEAFIQSLGDATDFSINCTSFDNELLFFLKDRMDNNKDVISSFASLL